MSKIRTLFLGTADFAVSGLKALQEDEHFEVVKVISQPDRPAGRKMKLQASPVKQCALDLGIEVMTPEKIRVPEVLAEIQKLRCEVAVVIAYGQILPEKFFSLFTYGAVNVHGSLLPRWRGAAPIQRAIEAGDTVTGVCLQKMVKELDAGDIIGERKINLSQDMMVEELYEKLAFLSKDLLQTDLMDFIRGNLSAEKQDPNLVTYAHKIEKTEGEIDWSLSALEIYNKYRALSAWPGVWTYLNRKRLKIKKMRLSEGKGRPGEVLKKEMDLIQIACKDGAIEVLELQPESKSSLSVKDFLNGFDLPKELPT